MSKAITEYEAAFVLDSNFETAFEVEDFIDWYLTVDPTKYQLRYCLGLINLRKKQDLELSAAEFSKFIESDAANGNKFAEIAKKAEEHLSSLG